VQCDTRLAVHSDWQNRRIVAGLLLDALMRTLQACGHWLHPRACVHAKDEPAAAFYRHFGFVPSPTDKRHLFMPIKDTRAMAGG